MIYWNFFFISCFFITDINMTELLGGKEPPHPFQWEDDSRDSQDDLASILQTSLDDRDDSSNSVGVGEASPPRMRKTSRERLVLRLKRVHDSYYMVEDMEHPGYLNYSHIRSDGRNLKSCICPFSRSLVHILSIFTFF